MLLILQGCLDLNLKCCDLYSETWREFVSRQIATSIGFLHSKKSLIGEFSSLEIFFWFLLSIALSVLFSFNDKQRLKLKTSVESSSWA
ncbi:hypothetical protein P8452_46624 [Trifolium repens]|nr:hypothetical protein P8452_46624 [Trifolium repens]